MRKCFFCGEKKGLKNIWVEEDENDEFNDEKSCCKDCFFDNELENDSIVDRDNWDEYDYNWKLKKKVPQTSQVEGKREN